MNTKASVFAVLFWVGIAADATSPARADGPINESVRTALKKNIEIAQTLIRLMEQNVGERSLWTKNKDILCYRVARYENVAQAIGSLSRAQNANLSKDQTLLTGEIAARTGSLRGFCGENSVATDFTRAIKRADADELLTQILESKAKINELELLLQ